MDLLNNGFSTTQKRLYILAEKTLERLEIQFIPQEIVAERTRNLAEVQIVGRNTPQYQHMSGAKQIRLQLDFYADDQARQSVINKVRFIESLMASDGKRRTSQRVKLIYGDLFRNELWVIKAASSTLSMFSRAFGMLPQQAFVEMTLVHDPDENLTWNDIR